MNDVIKQLKENEKPFGLMSAEMQEWVKSHKKSQIWLDYTRSGGWCNVSNLMCHKNSIYRLRPDYTEPVEDEYALCEIKLCTSRNALYYTPDGADSGYKPTITYAPETPNFAGYLYEDGIVRPHSVSYEMDGDYYDSVVLRDGYPEVHLPVRPTHVVFRKSS